MYHSYWYLLSVMHDMVLCISVTSLWLQYSGEALCHALLACTTSSSAPQPNENAASNHVMNQTCAAQSEDIATLHLLGRSAHHLPWARLEATGILSKKDYATGGSPINPAGTATSIASHQQHLAAASAGLPIPVPAEQHLASQITVLAISQAQDCALPNGRREHPFDRQIVFRRRHLYDSALDNTH